MTFRQQSGLSFLSPHADRHSEDIYCLFVSLFVCPQILCNGYLRRGLTHGNEILSFSLLQKAAVAAKATKNCGRLFF